MYLISLKSTHHALMLEHLMKKNNIASITIPTPRAISKSCGMSIKLKEDVELQRLIDLATEHQLLVVGIFLHKYCQCIEYPFTTNSDPFRCYTPSRRLTPQKSPQLPQAIR